ncbi:MAG: hypothetical protein GQ542_18665 [Desulforhopalus sp.]|nr:hypothetical protein [Desulforhopalus sp.]
MPELRQTHVYQLKVWLQGISPMIWRRLPVRSDSTVADLHYTIQIESMQNRGRHSEPMKSSA